MLVVEPGQMYRVSVFNIPKPEIRHSNYDVSTDLTVPGELKSKSTRNCFYISVCLRCFILRLFSKLKRTVCFGEINKLGRVCASWCRLHSAELWGLLTLILMKFSVFLRLSRSQNADDPVLHRERWVPDVLKPSKEWVSTSYGPLLTCRLVACTAGSLWQPNISLAQIGRSALAVSFTPDALCDEYLVIVSCSAIRHVDRTYKVRYQRLCIWGR